MAGDESPSSRDFKAIHPVAHLDPEAAIRSLSAVPQAVGKIKRASKARHLSVDMSRVGSNSSVGSNAGLGPRLSMQVNNVHDLGHSGLGQIRQSLGLLQLSGGRSGISTEIQQCESPVAERPRRTNWSPTKTTRRQSPMACLPHDLANESTSTNEAEPGYYDRPDTALESAQQNGSLNYYFQSLDEGSPTNSDFSMPVYSEIRPYLLVGSEEIFTQPGWLQLMTDELKVTHILNMAEEANYPQVACRKEFKYMKYGTADHAEQNMDEAVEIALRFIDEARRTPNSRIFVHCKAGKSRSVTIVLAHLMRAEHKDLKQTYDDVRSRRSGIEPNLNFIQKLREIELSVVGYNSDLASLYK